MAFVARVKGRISGLLSQNQPLTCDCSLRFLLLACDGLWKGFSVDSALKFINNIIEVRKHLFTYRVILLVMVVSIT